MRRVAALLLIVTWLCARAAPVPLRWEGVSIAGKAGFWNVTAADGRLTVTPSKTPAPRPAWLVPGIIDAHVHLALVDARKVARGGVTTVRDLGWDPLEILKLQQRNQPRVLVAGPILTAPGGYPARAGWCPASTALPVAGEDEARAAVQRLVKLPVQVIKVALEPRAGPTLTLAQLKAIVTQAHQHGLEVAAHVSTPAELEKALAAGVDELAHFMFDDTSVPDATLDRMVRAGTRVCPTLHIRPSAPRLDNLRRFVARGGRVVYGTDLGNYGPRPGIDLTELELMGKAGMTPAQILASATTGLGLQDRGRLETGQKADFLVLDRDPLKDLSALGELRQVILGGVPLD